MPTKVLNKKIRGSYRRNTMIGLAVAASLGLGSGCNSSTVSPVTDMAGTGDPDLSIPITPPPGSNRITVTLGGTGTGTVSSQPAGITCTGGATGCIADFQSGSSVTLTAAGSGGSVFTGWAGACAGQGAVCTLTALSADQATTASFGPQSCSPDGICWEAPLPFGYDLNSVAAITASDVWAVGNSGAAVHYDGKNWVRVPTGTSADLKDVWARNTSDVWATAGAGLMLHWNGTAWAKVNTGFANDVCNLVWGTANRVFVATAFEYLLIYDGTTWTKNDLGTRVDTPLGAIHGTSNTDVWVYGTDRYICHWTGASSCVRPDPATNVAYNNYGNSIGAFSVSATDAWEVTSTGLIIRANPVAGAGTFFGFNVLGTNPAPAVTAGNVAGLWGTSASSMFVNGPAATLYRYDGTKWNPSTTGVRDVVLLSKVHGTSATDVWSVGQRGVISHFDGSLSAVKRGNIFSGSNMTAVWASGLNDAWFTTSAGTVVHYDGAAFTESAPLVTGGGSGLRTIWGSSATDIWVAGGDGLVPVIKHWNGTAWAQVQGAPAYPASNVDTLFASSATTAFAAGAPALAVEKWDGTSWKADVTFGTLANPVIALWGSGDANVLAVEGSSKKMWLYNGAVWAVDNRLAPATNLSAVGGSSATDIWAGATQSVYHFNGTTWSAAMALPTATGSITSVSSVSATDAWAIDSVGATFHYDGTTWKQLDTGISTASATKLTAYSVNTNLTWLAGRGILSVRK